MPLQLGEIMAQPFRNVEKWSEAMRARPFGPEWLDKESPRRRKLRARTSPLRNRVLAGEERRLDVVSHQIQFQWIRRAGLAVYHMLSVHAIIFQGLLDEFLNSYGLTKHDKRAEIPDVMVSGTQSFIGMYICRLTNLFELSKEEQAYTQWGAERYDHPCPLPRPLKRVITSILHDMGFNWEGLRMKIAVGLLTRLWGFNGMKQGNSVATIRLGSNTEIVEQVAFTVWGLVQVYVIKQDSDKRLYQTSSLDGVTRELMPGPKGEEGVTEDLYTELVNLYDATDIGGRKGRTLKIRVFERQIYKHLLRTVLALHECYNDEVKIDMSQLKHMVGWRTQLCFHLQNIILKLFDAMKSFVCFTSVDMIFAWTASCVAGNFVRIFVVVRTNGSHRNLFSLCCSAFSADINTGGIRLLL